MLPLLLRHVIRSTLHVFVLRLSRATRQEMPRGARNRLTKKSHTRDNRLSGSKGELCQNVS